MLRREREALRLLGAPGRVGPAPRYGCVRLIGELPDGLLLEEVVPGDPVSSLPDDEATVVLARCLRALWRPVPVGCGLPTVERECAALWVGAGLPAPVVERARRALTGLLASAPDAVVLHGDLHHGNLLRTRDGWLAIDPHGLVGEPAYDVGPLLFNPLEREVAGLVDRRLDLLAAELGLARERLRRWGLVRAVLACSWSVQAGEELPSGIWAVAECLASGP